MQTIQSPKATPINDTRLASTLGYLGYPVDFKPTVHERTGQKHVQFFFDQQSTRFTVLPSLDQLLKQRGKGQITDPHHLMNVCSRAHKNYDAIMRWQKDQQQQRLHLDDSARAYTYQAGVPLPAIGQLKFIDHLQLAAALGEVGFQIHNILGQDREHAYGLPLIGLPLNDSHGESMRCQLLNLIQMAPTRDDPRRLALEVEQPMHPLVVAYNLLRCRAIFKKQIDTAQANLLIEDGGRQALISMKAHNSGHVMDHVTAHFKAPPLP